jgi:hypothetical protein
MVKGKGSLKAKNSPIPTGETALFTKTITKTRNEKQ